MAAEEVVWYLRPPREIHDWLSYILTNKDSFCCKSFVRISNALFIMSLTDENIANDMFYEIIIQFFGVYLHLASKYERGVVHDQPVEDVAEYNPEKPIYSVNMSMCKLATSTARVGILLKIPKIIREEFFGAYLNHIIIENYNERTYSIQISEKYSSTIKRRCKSSLAVYIAFLCNSAKIYNEKDNSLLIRDARIEYYLQRVLWIDHVLWSSSKDNYYYGGHDNLNGIEDSDHVTSLVWSAADEYRLRRLIDPTTSEESPKKLEKMETQSGVCATIGGDESPTISETFYRYAHRLSYGFLDVSIPLWIYEKLAISRRTVHFA